MRPAIILALVAACGGEPGPEPIQNPVRDAYDTWIKVEPPGAV